MKIVNNIIDNKFFVCYTYQGYILKCLECIHTSKKKILCFVILAVAIAAFTACVIYFVVDYFHYKSITNIVNPSISSEAVSSKKEVSVPVDFDELTALNNDIYAWIRIPYAGETDKFIVDYPILQNEESRNYYLNHNVNRKSSVYGAIYTQDYNEKDFSDFNTLIYGHNMRNGTMFGTLKKYRDEAFFKENNEIYIYQPGRILKYKIFAAYVFDDRHILMHFDNDIENERQQYLDTVFSERKLSANFDKDITVTTKDKIITLSTCTSKDNERYLVQGVLVYDSDADS